MLFCVALLCMRSPAMSMQKASLSFEFPRIPFAAGIQHIHSPEYFAGIHGVPSEMFRIESVGEPKVLDSRTTVTFNCSTLFVPQMRVRMFSSQPDESNLLFFKDDRALYGMRFKVGPTRAFKSHRLHVEFSFFDALGRPEAKSLLPIFLFFSRMESDCCIPIVRENRNFTRYRRAVLRGKGSDEFWIMAERVIREYR